MHKINCSNRAKETYGFTIKILRKNAFRVHNAHTTRGLRRTYFIFGWNLGIFIAMYRNEQPLLNINHALL